MSRRHSAGKPALDLLEESVHLLRRAPAGALAMYYLGALPFILALLYFWADMSGSAFAHERAAPASCTVALLFVWMKCWQTVFCARLRGIVTPGPAEHWDLRRCARLVCVQAALQPLALIARPVALLMTVPYVFVYAFFQNVLLFGDGQSARIRAPARRAAVQATLWPREHHLAQAILTLFGLFVWINVLVAMIVIPIMLKSLFGIETPFARSWSTVVNTTFVAVGLAVAYLCVNPITQAFYVLRCFYGESLRSGEDLRVDLSRLIVPRVPLSALLILLLLLIPATSARAQSSAPKTPEAARLNESIDEVLTRREFTWRMPREPIPKSERGALENFVDGIVKTIRGWFKPVKRWIAKVMDWIDEYLRRRQPDESGEQGSAAWLKSLRWLFYALIAGSAAVLGYLIWKRWKTGRRTIHAVAEAVPAAPDLSAENVTADQLPEDGWMRLAREMRERGELRLALRALFLAGLAHLGARDLIVLAKHKSNRDYDRDLRRRARSRAELVTVFDENMEAFERAWYGIHEVRGETLSQFSENLEKIRAC